MLTFKHLAAILFVLCLAIMVFYRRLLHLPELLFNHGKTLHGCAFGAP